jgi:hypothetical protein
MLKLLLENEHLALLRQRKRNSDRDLVRQQLRPASRWRFQAVQHA